ncbi:MAG TPA: DUF5103 domain-containing protein, partial [Bacteroidia bacterium]|nr:DUF5103 domain-containing protein [Bacteroidia bacterium]
DENNKNHIELTPEENRRIKNYIFYPDFNGSFLIKNKDMNGNQDTEADYAYVHFFLPYPAPEASGNFYLLGKMSNWKLDKAN